MSEQTKQQAFAALESELFENGPCTFGWLWPIANVALGHARHDHHGPGYRLTDQWLQRGRKKGELKCERAKGGFVWSKASGSTGERASLADANS